ncbi:phenylalanine--tRNA ligase subunit alpha [bacterium]|nr:phenylalanine--tRNA ligase subunit alpha [bacterium]
MKEELKNIKEKILAEIKKINLPEEFYDLEKKYLGRKGEFTKLTKSIKDLTQEQKPIIGKLANEIKIELEEVFSNLKGNIEEGFDDLKNRINFDATIQSKKKEVGHLHPNTIIQNEVVDIFSSMGFMVLDGPELESEYYNFETLNVLSTHPARDMQDTYFIKTDKNFKKSEKLVLRTHTSAMQVRAIEEFGAPLRAIFPGKCFRNEATDASHDNTFYQLEGLMIDKNISISNLVAVMSTLLAEIFKKDVKTRLRPGYFPFVEPGFELDINCLICGGKGCSVCGDGWVELIPCGLVHPQVIKNGGLDPQEYSGFAFGMGLTRLVMMRYGINDIRLLQSGDLRFTKQF